MLTRHRHCGDRTTFLPQLSRFTVVSVITALLNAAVFLVARVWCEPFTANLIAVVVSMAASTEMHRRLTFRHPALRGWRLHSHTALAIVYYAFANSGALLMLRTISGSTDPLLECIVVGVAGLLAAVMRFLILRHWSSAPHRDSGSRS